MNIQSNWIIKLVCKSSNFYYDLKALSKKIRVFSFSEYFDMDSCHIYGNSKQQLPIFWNWAAIDAGKTKRLPCRSTQWKPEFKPESCHTEELGLDSYSTSHYYLLPFHVSYSFVVTLNTGSTGVPCFISLSKQGRAFHWFFCDTNLIYHICFPSLKFCWILFCFWKT